MNAANRILSMSAALAIVMIGGTAVAAEAPATPPKPSPALGAVEAARNAPGPYPQWSTFPKAPKDTPTQAQIAADVAQVETAGADLSAGVSAITWGPGDTQAFSDRARHALDPALSQPAPADQVARSAAFARESKALATPPPQAPR